MSLRQLILLIQKNAIINHFAVAVGVNVDDSVIFTFDRVEHFANCRATCPLWAVTLGPEFAAQAGMNAVAPVGRLYLMVGTQRIVPEVVFDYFFQTR
jgi:hypothetical protein